MKKLLKFYLPLTLVLGLMMSACYYDNEELLYPELNNNCDTANISYSQHISKIVSENCLSCHGSTFQKHGGGLRLDSYQLLKNNIGSVINAVKHEDGYKPMPNNGGKLKSCLIAQLEIWRNNSTPNN